MSAVARRCVRVDGTSISGRASFPAGGKRKYEKSAWVPGIERCGGMCKRSGPRSLGLGTLGTSFMIGTGVIWSLIWDRSYTLR